MPVFRVDDMTCGHCAAAITEAVLALDAGATVDASLRRHLVTVDSQASLTRQRDAITAAGFTPVPVDLRADAGQPPRRPTACCGCCD
jgi:copper chaperone